MMLGVLYEGPLWGLHSLQDTLDRKPQLVTYKWKMQIVATIHHILLFSSKISR